MAKAQLTESVQMTEEQAIAENMKLAESRAEWADKLVEKWSRTREGVNLDVSWNINATKARTGAYFLEKQNKLLNKLSETQISSAFQTTPEYVKKIVRIGGANSNRSVIFTDWFLQTTDDAVYFVDRVRERAIRGAVADENIYTQKRQNYASSEHKETAGTGDAVTTTFAFTAAILPIKMYHVAVLVDGEKIANDNGAGGFVSSILNTTTSTVNYTTGVHSLVFNVAPTSGAVIEVVYNFDTEVSATFDAQLGRTKIKVSKQRFDVQLHPLGYSFSDLAEITLSTAGVITNMTEEMVKIIGEEHAMRMDYQAFNKAKQLALGNPIATFDTDFAAAQEDNDYNHAQRIISTIADMEGLVYDDVKRGELNVGIAGRKALTYLKKHAKWETDKTQPHVAGSYLAGYLDNIAIYRTPSDVATVADNEVMLTFKNVDVETDTALIFGTMEPITASLRYPNFQTDGTIAALEDHMVVTPKFVRLLRLENLV